MQIFYTVLRYLILHGSKRLLCGSQEKPGISSRSTFTKFYRLDTSSLHFLFVVWYEFPYIHYSHTYEIFSRKEQLRWLENYFINWVIGVETIFRILHCLWIFTTLDYYEFFNRCCKHKCGSIDTKINFHFESVNLYIVSIMCYIYAVSIKHRS